MEKTNTYRVWYRSDYGLAYEKRKGNSKSSVKEKLPKRIKSRLHEIEKIN